MVTFFFELQCESSWRIKLVRPISPEHSRVADVFVVILHATKRSYGVYSVDIDVRDSLIDQNAGSIKKVKIVVTNFVPSSSVIVLISKSRRYSRFIFLHCIKCKANATCWRHSILMTSPHCCDAHISITVDTIVTEFCLVIFVVMSCQDRVTSAARAYSGEIGQINFIRRNDSHWNLQKRMKFFYAAFSLSAIRIYIWKP